MRGGTDAAVGLEGGGVDEDEADVRLEEHEHGEEHRRRHCRGTAQHGTAHSGHVGRTQNGAVVK